MVDWKNYERYFKKDEFVCKCGCGQEDMDETHMDMLFFARKLAQIPFIITSGFRCTEHNKAVGGVEHSEHCFGKGTDIKCITNKDRLIIIDSLLKAGFNRIGVARGYIHTGSTCSPEKKGVWLY